MKKAIQKARDVGWNFEHEVNSYHATFLLSPLFWQALGKACGWEGKCADCYIEEPYKWCQSGSHLNMDKEKYHKNIPWVDCWHRFIDHLTEGKPVDEFFHNLIK